MPNGIYDRTRDEWSKITAFFAQHSANFMAFAAAHNMSVDEYYHDAPSWTFRFQHPHGGAAGIHVERVNDSTVRVGRSWYIDDRESFTRFLKSDESGDLDLSAIKLRDVLEDALKEIACWSKGEMTAHGGYERFWSQYTEEEWRQASSVELLPKVKL